MNLFSCDTSLHIVNNCTSTDSKPSWPKRFDFATQTSLLGITKFQKYREWWSCFRNISCASVRHDRDIVTWAKRLQFLCKKVEVLVEKLSRSWHGRKGGNLRGKFKTLHFWTNSWHFETNSRHKMSWTWREQKQRICFWKKLSFWLKERHDCDMRKNKAIPLEKVNLLVERVWRS